MNRLTLPGLIDIHVHFRDPGQTEKEDFLTGTQAALAGGFTTVVDMPNNKVPITTRERLEEKITNAKEKTVANLGLYFGSLGDNLGEFAKVQDKVLGLKLYLNETTGNFLIDKNKLEAIFDAWPGPVDGGGSPILLHAEDDAVAAVIEIVRKTRKQAHFCHISTASDLKQIIKAKADNLPITCGVTPHHLFLTTDDLNKLGNFGRMKPPLRSREEVQFLWDNLKHIDVIESDHAPHTREEKANDPAPYGVPGLETTLPLLLTAVSEKKLKIEDIKRLCHDNPMKILHLQPTNDTIEIDLDALWTISDEKLFTKCHWTPFAGRKVQGKIISVTMSGKKVFEDGKILVMAGGGKIL